MIIATEMKHAVFCTHRQFKKTDRTIKAGRLMRLVSPHAFVSFCATFALRSWTVPSRDHFQKEKYDGAVSSDDLSS